MFLHDPFFVHSISIREIHSFLCDQRRGSLRIIANGRLRIRADARGFRIGVAWADYIAARAATTSDCIRWLRHLHELTARVADARPRADAGRGPRELASAPRSSARRATRAPTTGGLRAYHVIRARGQASAAPFKLRASTSIPGRSRPHPRSHAARRRCWGSGSRRPPEVELDATSRAWSRWRATILHPVLEQGADVIIGGRNGDSYVFRRPVITVPEAQATSARCGARRSARNRTAAKGDRARQRWRRMRSRSPPWRPYSVTRSHRSRGRDVRRSIRTSARRGRHARMSECVYEQVAEDHAASPAHGFNARQVSASSSKARARSGERYVGRWWASATRTPSPTSTR